MDSIKILGCGYQPGQKRISNQALEACMETSHEWIVSRTGIEARYFNETWNTSDLALMAAKKALFDASMQADALSYIIVATLSPDHFTPSTACLVQSGLGVNDKQITAFDLNAACSGFIFALRTAAALLENGQKALVIGAETLSKILDWNDRSTAVLFGDGAGACIIEKQEGHPMYCYTKTQGDIKGVLLAKGAVLHPFMSKDQPGYSYLHMAGSDVFRFAVQALPEAISQVIDQAGWQKEEIDLIIAHQANKRIIEYAAKKMGVLMERFYMNLQEYGNTSAASIPMALAQAKKENRLKPGMKIVLAGFGAGLSYGAIALEWPGEEESCF